MIEAFDLERVSSNPAAFDTEKLTWLNNRYIQSLDDDDLAARCLHFLTEEGLMPDPVTLRAAMPIVKERMKTLAEAPALLRFLFTDDLEPNEKAAALIAKAPDGYVGQVADALERVEPWQSDAITGGARCARQGAGPESHEGVPAGQGGGHRLERLSAASGIARAARSRADPRAAARVRGLRGPPFPQASGGNARPRDPRRPVARARRPHRLTQMP